MVGVDATMSVLLLLSLCIDTTAARELQPLLNYSAFSLPRLHIPYFLHSNQYVATICQDDPLCPFKVRQQRSSMYMVLAFPKLSCSHAWLIHRFFHFGWLGGMVGSSVRSTVSNTVGSHEGSEFHSNSQQRWKKYTSSTVSHLVN